MRSYTLKIVLPLLVAQPVLANESTETFEYGEDSILFLNNQPGEKNKRIPAAIYMSPEGKSKDKILYKSVYSDATLCDLELTVCISTNLEKDKETEKVSRLYWKKEFGDIAQRQFWYPMNKKS